MTSRGIIRIRRAKRDAARARRAVLPALLMVLAPVPPAFAAGDDLAATKATLMRQIDYWLLHGDSDRAAYALNRLLRLTPPAPAPSVAPASALVDVRLDPAPAEASMPLDPAPEDAAPAIAVAPPDPPPAPEPARLSLRDVLAANQALLRRDPADSNARQQAFDAALRLQDMRDATALASEALRLSPEDPRSWAMAADLDTENGIPARAAEERQTARRVQARRDAELPDGSTAASAPAIDIADASVPPRNAPVLEGEGPLPALHSVPPDPLAAEIDRRIAAVRDDLAAKVYIGPTFLNRSGAAGLDRLFEVAPKMEGSFSPDGVGTLTVDATPIFLDAGRPSTVNQSFFGTGALNTGALGTGRARGTQTAAGVALDAAYAYRWLKADIGTTPLGFDRQTVVGGIALSPRVTQDLTLHLVGERRPVTDSLLSYAGTLDPRTGAHWGGVMQERLSGRADLKAGSGELHADAGFDWIGGNNVKFNHEYDLGAGGSYPLWRPGNGVLTAGADLVFVSFARDLNHFTLGQGGYFSPQSYAAGFLPIRYAETDGDLKWSVAGQIGYQRYRQGDSAYFPNNPALQEQLESRVEAGAASRAVYPGVTASGVAGGAGGSVEYNITPALLIGAQANFIHAEDFSEEQATLFLRYILNGRSK